MRQKRIKKKMTKITKDALSISLTHSTIEKGNRYKVMRARSGRDAYLLYRLLSL